MLVSAPPQQDIAARIRESAKPVLTTAERAADSIRDLIIKGFYAPGDRISEQILCENLDVSRNTIREALSKLVIERLILRQANRGVSVARPNSNTIIDVYRARRAIEPSAAAFGEAYGSDGMNLVQSAVADGMKMADADDWHGVASANQDFHRSIASLMGSERIDGQMSLLLAEMRLIFLRVKKIREFHEPYLHRNKQILDLLANGDRVLAASELTTYLDDARTQLLREYEDRGLN